MSVTKFQKIPQFRFSMLVLISRFAFHQMISELGEKYFFGLDSSQAAFNWGPSIGKLKMNRYIYTGEQEMH